MASDWIKMRTDLYRDPKVSVIADELMDPEGRLARYVSQYCQCDMSVTRNVTRNAVVGALVAVWGVMRQRGKRRDDDLVCAGVTPQVLDDIADLPGFGSAMESAGWVIESLEGIEFPNFFEENNVDPSEKKSASAAERQRKYRERQKTFNSDGDSDVTRDVTVTHREEKRREEVLTTTSESADSNRCPVNKIIDAYKANATSLVQPRIITDATKAAIAARWRQSEKHQSIEFWQDFFAHCEASDFLAGRANGRNGGKPFRADLDWTVKAGNFAKIINGNYHGDTV
jgi:hypothetical protein